jgi:hypothetical protein
LSLHHTNHITGSGGKFLNFITKLINFDEVSRRNIPTQFVQFDRVDSKKKRLIYENDVDEDNNRSE